LAGQAAEDLLDLGEVKQGVFERARQQAPFVSFGRQGNRDWLRCKPLHRVPADLEGRPGQQTSGLGRGYVATDHELRERANAEPSCREDLRIADQLGRERDIEEKIAA